MKPLVVDVETTISNKGNVYDYKNKCCLIGLFDGTTYSIFDIEYSDHSYKENLQKIQSILNTFDVLVGFNIKFDISWCRRYGIDFSKHSVWDCQLYDFISNNQTTPYPSLNSVSEKHGFGQKLDIIEKEYWGKGVDTPDIPYELLAEYLKQDLKLTWDVYKKQLEDYYKR